MLEIAFESSSLYIPLKIGSSSRQPIEPSGYLISVLKLEQEVANTLPERKDRVPIKSDCFKSLDISQILFI